MKFEYGIQFIDAQYPDRHLEILNEMGKEGWEVINAIPIQERTIFILLKRSIPEEEPANPDWTLEGKFIGPGLNG